MSDCTDGSMGWWVIFPIIFATFMLVAIFRMLGGGNPLRMIGMMGGARGADGEDGGSRPSIRDGDRSAETPLEAVQRRYANGEISREEFQRIRDDLG
ncbi:MAG: SHOCT domain-containing protein [Dehalococcoidia bacterium]